jgi:hypothetical protein
MKTTLYTPLLLVSFAILTSCGGGDKASTETSTEKAADTKTEKTENPSTETSTQKAPIVNISDSLEQRENVICIKDSAATEEGLTAKLKSIFGTKIPEILKANKMKADGYPMAWFKNQTAPYFFEAGIPVDKAPAKLGKGMYMKTTTFDSALVAHYWGPNNLKSQGYDALKERLAENKKTKISDAYEIYKYAFDSTQVETDPYKLETTLVMPYKSKITNSARYEDAAKNTPATATKDGKDAKDSKDSKDLKDKKDSKDTKDKKDKEVKKKKEVKEKKATTDKVEKKGEE